VFNRISDFNFGEIRPTAGVGLRYRSPIGPIRVDVGFKLDRQPLPDGSLERLTAVHISLGQAF
jgi:outer membrane protein insertion porin family